MPDNRSLGHQRQPPILSLSSLNEKKLLPEVTMIHQSPPPPLPPSRVPLLGQLRSTGHSSSTGSTGSSFGGDSTTTTAAMDLVVVEHPSLQQPSHPSLHQPSHPPLPLPLPPPSASVAAMPRLIKSSSASAGSPSLPPGPPPPPYSKYCQSISAKPSPPPQSHPQTHPPPSVVSTSSSLVLATCASANSTDSSPSSPPPLPILSNSPVVFGELVILGYNGALPQGEKNRRRSKYQLLRRPVANGIKKSKHYSVKQPQMSQAIQDKEQHSISFTLSRSQAIIVEYQRDEETDMFQIGRSSENPIDFVVIDTIMSDPTRFLAASAPDAAPKLAQQSTISRFACRILIDRRPPYTARIYAAGFDSSKNIFLGEKATKWQTNGEIDGLTTNGILIMHPKRSFITDGEEVKSVGGVWREVSVCGEIYSVRETRSASQKGVRIETETNVLQDGTLVDLCGATLMWRSADGLHRSPTKRHLEEMVDALNAQRPQCPVGLNTLVIPRKSASLGAADDKQPYVYLNCGHVQGYHDWGQTKHSNNRTCPMCFKTGPTVKLAMGIEPSFCTNTAQPNYCFNPCGHMASEDTVKYWSQVLIPYGTNGFHAMCPFCATPLQGENGYVKLIFQ